MTADPYPASDLEARGPRRVQELPEDERPRERLLRLGHESLRTEELLQILIGSGVQGHDVIEMSRSLLRQYGLSGLLQAHPQDLLRQKGLGPATVTRILAAVALGWRAAREDRERGGRIGGPPDVWERYGVELANLPHEEVRVLVLDRQHRVMAAPTVYKGTVHGANMRIAELFREVIVRQGVGMIMLHNHPSGDPTPSGADRSTTVDLVRAADLMDIDLMDHIIIGGGERPFLSMRAEGLFNEAEESLKRR